VNEALYR